VGVGQAARVGAEVHEVSGGAWGAAATTFLLILPAELPDKTFVATVVLASRLRPLPVWIGVALAFAVQCVVAVAFGSVLSLLPRALVAAAAAVLFAIGAVVMIRGGLRPHESALAEEADEEAEVDERLGRRGSVVGPWRTAGTAFAVLFVAEWGDLSQLVTAAQAARTGQPWGVLVGSWTALVAVAAVAALAGRQLQRRVRLERVRLASGALLSVLAVVAAVEAVRAL
jgi:Ca2+/H+ antiporter, TMEM165/GDT1 family